MKFAFLYKTEEEKSEMLAKTHAGSKARWDNMSIEEKKEAIGELRRYWREWYDSLTPEEFLELIKSRLTYTSKLENRVYEAIKFMNPKRQHWIDRNSYDFKISENIILEINGDYWHCNPELYNESGVVIYPVSGVTSVKSVWEKDKLKKEKAEKHGYKIFYLWEKDINKMSDKNIVSFVENLFNIA